MDKIIEKLFNIHLQNKDFLTALSNKDSAVREWQLYELLLEKLPVEEKEIFAEYSRLCNQRQGNEIQLSYEQGFKTAIRLMIESINP